MKTSTKITLIPIIILVVITLVLAVRGYRYQTMMRKSTYATVVAQLDTTIIRTLIVDSEQPCWLNSNHHKTYRQRLSLRENSYHTDYSITVKGDTLCITGNVGVTFYSDSVQHFILNGKERIGLTDYL